MEDSSGHDLMPMSSPAVSRSLSLSSSLFLFMLTAPLLSIQPLGFSQQRNGAPQPATGLLRIHTPGEEITRPVSQVITFSL